MGNQLTNAAPSPLIAARTIHLNSATGSDTTGDGSSAHPWQTLAKGWADRLTYGELRAIYIIQLHGVGPYTMPVMGASVCGVDGYFQVYGDSAVDVVAATGTFTGDLNTTTFQLPTSAGLGSNTLKDAFLEITSGNASGVRSNIVTNTDTSITIPIRQWRATLGAVANADTFRVFTPGTVINCPAAATGVICSGCYDWQGHSEYPLGYASGGSVRHGFYNVQFTGTQLSARNSSLALIGVRSSLSVTWFDRTELVGSGPTNSFTWGVGTNTNTNKLSSYGFIDTASTMLVGNRSIVVGVFCLKNAPNIGTGLGGEGDLWQQNGGRYEGGVILLGGTFSSSGGGATYTLISGPLSISKVAKLALLSGTTTRILFAITSGSCIDVSDGSFVHVNGTTGMTGGTTDAAGYAIRLRGGGGRVLMTGALNVTGGTAGADIKTSVLGAQPAAFLAAAGDFISDLGGGEIVARI